MDRLEFLTKEGFENANGHLSGMRDSFQSARQAIDNALRSLGVDPKLSRDDETSLHTALAGRRLRLARGFLAMRKTLEGLQGFGDEMKGEMSRLETECQPVWDGKGSLRGGPGWYIAYFDEDVTPPEDAEPIHKGIVTVFAASRQEARSRFPLGRRGAKSVDASRGPFPSAAQAKNMESW